MYEHSDKTPHHINPVKAQARQTDSNAGLKHKYEEADIIMSGSPKKRHAQRDLFSRTVESDSSCLSPPKQVS